MPVAIETKARASLTIPADVYDAYEKFARDTRKSMDQVFSERLTACVNHRSLKPIHLTDTDRQRLEKAVGQNLSTPQDVIEAVESALRLTLSGISVPLRVELADRLHSRCFEKDFGAWVAERAIEKLEEYTGIR